MIELCHWVRSYITSKHYGDFLSDAATETDGDWRGVLRLGEGWSMQMHPVECQTGPGFRQRGHVPLLHKQALFFTLCVRDPYSLWSTQWLFDVVTCWFIYLEWSVSDVTLPFLFILTKPTIDVWISSPMWFFFLRLKMFPFFYLQPAL